MTEENKSDAVALVVRQIVKPVMVEDRNRLWRECPHQDVTVLNLLKFNGAFLECNTCAIKFSRTPFK